MADIQVLSIEQAPEKSKPLFEAIKGKFGKIPNIFALMAYSPATLEAFLSYKELLSKGELSSQEQEAVSLVVAQQNKCDYCLAAHSAIAKTLGISDEEILRNRKCDSSDQKIKALLALSRNIVATNGFPSDGNIDAFIEAGYSKSALVELVGFVALNIFTNYLNHVVKTPIDFPEAQALDL
ncbi:MAG: carboxymuconolactone decarboxylase family protein [Candidatus Omnitrophica bacterium]|nr:carboxymuconolactone decarboxylase family protein [Candidatus Omnitrophota bacterium]MBU1997050.1 carboxymuconolactone decarboxylase family protein [Candidatus Omnitrophota bacterium]MBU4334753.1 carboxymuconolactone decarboxylase family protein [Candidatus Omnitrophota bacterium]